MDRSCSVLVIEDDEAARAPLCEFLEAAGYQVRAAGGGAEAMEALGTAPAEAVLLDLVMPEPDGFEVLRRVRERDPRLPVIVLSALSQTEDVVRAMKLGATDYLPKPFDPAELDLGPPPRPRRVGAPRAAAGPRPGRRGGGGPRPAAGPVGGHGPCAGAGPADRRHRRPGAAGRRERRRQGRDRPAHPRHQPPRRCVPS